MPSYKKPPITEAIIAITFEVPENNLDYSKYAAAFSNLYSNNGETINLGADTIVSGDINSQAAINITRQKGLKLTSDDQAEIAVIWPANLVISRLAPYPGWDELHSRFIRDWKTWRRVAGYRKISFIGLRFINRIDAPMTSSIVEESEYLNFFVSSPSPLGPFSAYGAQAAFPLSDLKCNLIINSGLAASPLEKHVSLILDIDVVRHVDVPQKDDDISSLLALMRSKKNDVFEACVTDKARELFNS